jgi:hypothetical protein
MGPGYLTAVSDGVEIAVHAQPRASRSRLVGEHDGRLKVQLAAPPVDGLANEALTRLVADLLGVPRRQVEVVSGQTGRRKVVRVLGVALDFARAALEGALPGAPR